VQPREIITDISGKKILVTGATGHLGSNIVHALVDERACGPMVSHSTTNFR
jgi:FlaA1/EpsC-like NDP-sugar epimerase